MPQHNGAMPDPDSGSGDTAPSFGPHPGYGRGNSGMADPDTGTGDTRTRQTNSGTVNSSGIGQLLSNYGLSPSGVLSGDDR